MEHKRLRVTVVDMQPITPAVGGGRQRLLGLYHALGPDIDCTYVGTYDWPGESYRDQQITPGLREILVPLSDEHHAAAAALSKEIGGRTVIDIAFADQAYLSPDYLRVAREHTADADVVIFSHPWCFAPLTDALRPEQLIVYDSQNVEALLRTSLLDDLQAAAPLLGRVAELEQELCRRADLILACSDEDIDLFERIFNADPAKLHIVPNGAFVERFPEVGQVERMALRKKLGLPVGRAIAIFLGSMYGPNTDAACFIAQDMAPACPGMLFVIAGGVGDALAGIPLTDNLLVTGRVDDSQRDDLLLAADLALNPVAAGSGTNIKMFDYMAAGLPVLTTDIGARGICTAHSAPEGIFVEPLAAFSARCLPIATAALVDPAYSLAVRALVRKRYSWERISGELGSLLRGASVRHRIKTRATSATRVAMMTTWNVTCGIGEHASYLAEAMEAAGAEVVVLGNDLQGHQPLGFERDLHFAVSRTWHWDNHTWKSGIDQSRLGMLLQWSRPDLFVIQHHTAYAPFDDVEAAVEAARDQSIAVIVEMHNARDVPTENKERLCALGAHLIAHHSDGIADVSLANMPSTRVLPLPVHRSANHPRHRSVSPSGSIVISGFGFLRPYKGLPILIEALALLRPKYPGIRYVGLHALYAGDSSEQHLQECLQLAKMHGLLDSIQIETNFLSIEEIERRLSDADIVILPYQPSSEGASSAVNMALAAERPVIVSPSGIFKSVGNAVFMVTRHEPAAYAEALDLILSDPLLSETLTERASEWVEQNSYANAAALMLDPNYFSLQDPFLRGDHGSRLRANA
jgi:glycosyltransferase involved in cell wall biosynthesis